MEIQAAHAVRMGKSAFIIESEEGRFLLVSQGQRCLIAQGTEEGFYLQDVLRLHQEVEIDKLSEGQVAIHGHRQHGTFERDRGDVVGGK